VTKRGPEPSLLETINQLCLDRLGREPNLDSPAGYNDLIQWLKLHDQRPEHIVACDKWAVRKMVRAKADCLVPARLGATLEWSKRVLKCTHDCGSVQFVRTFNEQVAAQAVLKDCLARPYGVEKGEWAYRFIKPQIMTEKLLERGITDYKFHCSHGKVRWGQIIAERAHEDGPRETILAPDGSPTGLHMDQNMRHVPDGAYPGDEAWEKLTELAELLAAPWRYVRVDLYWSRGKAWFGELTFWPLAGSYTTADEPKFGEMLQLDLTERFEPIVK
jgi:hypothetical protein